MAKPGDEVPKGAGRRQASHADREQVIDVLKAAFVQGRLDGDEFGHRVDHARAARTCAELAAITADLPTGQPEAQPPEPTRTQKIANLMPVHGGGSDPDAETGLDQG